MVCYESDVTDEMMRQWKQENADLLLLTGLFCEHYVCC